MHRADHGEPVAAAQLVDELERVLLVAEVERARRLVEEQDRRRLRERACEHDPLALAAAERAERALHERGQPEPLDRRGRGAPVAAHPRRRGSRCAACAQQHVLGDGQRRRGLGELRHERDHRRELAPATVAAPGGRRAGCARSQGTSPASARSRLVLPAPLGPISASHSPGSTRQADAVDRAGAPERDAHGARPRRAALTAHPAAATQDDGEERRAEERGDDAERELGRRQHRRGRGRR